MKYTRSIVMCQDTFVSICLKLGIMLDPFKLHSLSDLDVHSRSKGYEKARTCAVRFYAVAKLHEAAQIFVMTD